MRKLFFILLVGLCLPPLWAGDDAKKHAWDIRLTLDDFVRAKPLGDTSDFQVAWNVKLEKESRWKGWTRFTYYKTKLYFDQENSWISGKYKNDNTLRLCQLVLDNAELYRRQEYNEMLRSGKFLRDKSIEYRGKRNEGVEVIKSMTRNGEDTVALSFYEKEIARELAETQDGNCWDNFDQYVGNCAGAFHASMGPYLECGQNDYFDKGKPFGLSMRCGFDVYGHLFLLDFSGSVSEGKCKRASGKINKGEAVGNTSLLFTYGYCQTPQARNRLYATASVGKRAFMIAKEKSDEKPRSCSGVDLGFGFLYEIPIYQNFMLHGTSQIGENVSSSMHCLYIKPQFDLYHNKQSSCWATAASLSIGYSWSLRGYERKK